MSCQSSFKLSGLLAYTIIKAVNAFGSEAYKNQIRARLLTSAMKRAPDSKKRKELLTIVQLIR